MIAEWKSRAAAFMKRNAPPGQDIIKEASWFIAGMPLSFLFSLLFLVRYCSAYDELYIWEAGEKILNPNAVIQPFDEILGPSLLIFYLMSFIMLEFIFYHWYYFHQGSRSVYLMKRLPQRGWMARYIFTLPLIGAALFGTAALLMRFLYFLIYLLATPDSCLPPAVWQQLWR